MRVLDDLDFVVRVHKEEDSMWATVDSLPGCFAAGDNLEELRVSLGESISAYLSTPDHWVSVKVTDDNQIEVSQAVVYTYA